MDHDDVVDHHLIGALAQEVTARAAVAVGLAGIALIHLLDSIGKWSETRYLFWMYVALMVGSLVGAGLVLFARTRLSWLAAAAIGSSALVGFILSRTVGLPHATEDIGNWTEPLGLASLFVEGVVVACSLAGYGFSRRVRRPVARTAARRRADLQTA